MKFKNHLFFSFEVIEKYAKLGLTADGTKGGFLLGESHLNGGIPVLSKFKDGYRIMAEFEGEEYLLNGGASKYYENRLYSINQPEIDRLTEYIKPVDLNRISIIDCTSKNIKFKSKFLLLDSRSSHFIVNKHSTAKHLKTLEELNCNIEGRYWGEPLTWHKPKLNLFSKIKRLFSG